jgi:predicted transcriptional regulator
MTLDKNVPYARQLDDYLMRRLDKMESAIEEMKEHHSDIAVKLNKLAEAHDSNKPFIDAMRSILEASGMLKWSVSTVVVICAGFAAVMTAWEALQKWLGK